MSTGWQYFLCGHVSGKHLPELWDKGYWICKHEPRWTHRSYDCHISSNNQVSLPHLWTFRYVGPSNRWFDSLECLLIFIISIQKQLTGKLDKNGSVITTYLFQWIHHMQYLPSCLMTYSRISSPNSVWWVGSGRKCKEKKHCLLKEQIRNNFLNKLFIAYSV